MSQAALALVALVLVGCYIFNVIQMFKKGNSTMGIVHIIGMFCGFGYFLMLIYGWMKVNEYSTTVVMIAYTIAFLLSFPTFFMTGLLN